MEDLIYSRMASDAQLNASLARFGDGPAVFWQRAAPDADRGWGKEQYPRIDFVVDMQAEPSRNLSGVLAVNIWCKTKNSSVAPEDIERIVRSLLHNAIAQEPGGDAICLSWTRSDNFEAKNEKEQDSYLCGYTMIFAVIALPSVSTTAPCPVAAINDFTRRLFPDVKVIGSDADEIDGWLDGNRQAVYWELSSLSPNKRTNACTWWDCTLTCHIFGGSEPGKVELASEITEHIACADHVIMRDKSPMHARKLVLNTGVDGITGGQIAASFLYGELLYDHFQRHQNPPQQPQKLRRTNFRMSVKEACEMAANASGEAYRANHAQNMTK